MNLFYYGKITIEFSIEKGNTNSRKRVEKIGLDSKSISEKLIQIYSANT